MARSGWGLARRCSAAVVEMGGKVGKKLSLALSAGLAQPGLPTISTVARRLVAPPFSAALQQREF